MLDYGTATYRILNINHRKELLTSLWVSPKSLNPTPLQLQEPKPAVLNPAGRKGGERNHCPGRFRVKGSGKILKGPSGFRDLGFRV